MIWGFFTLILVFFLLAFGGRFVSFLQQTLHVRHMLALGGGVRWE